MAGASVRAVSKNAKFANPMGEAPNRRGGASRRWSIAATTQPVPRPPAHVPRKLFSAILLGPEWPPVRLAKEAAGIDAISGGRLTLPADGDEVVGRNPDTQAEHGIC